MKTIKEIISAETPQEQIDSATLFYHYWKEISAKVNSYQLDDTAKVIMKAIYHSYPSKGLIISGSKGIGKTLNMDIFAYVNQKLFNNHTMTVEATELEIMYKIQGADVLMKYANCDTLILNDAGTESKLNDFGTVRNIVADLLFLRYRKFQKGSFNGNPKLTYITSNEKLSTLSGVEFYGSRIGDRLNEMCNYIELKGETKR